MTESDGWLYRYEKTHGDITYPSLYWAAVPMVVLGTVGLLWTLPIPDEFFEISPLLNWGTTFLMAAAVYYFIISVSLAIGLLPFVVGVGGIQMWLTQSDFSPLLNWGTTFLMATAVYYFIISVSLAIGMLPFVVGVGGIQIWLTQSDFSPLRVSLGLLLAGIIGLWMGHRNQSSLRPLLQDLQLMMIGPAWILSVIYRRIGIPL